ncbi:MAG: restriction endonuclease [Candidatus Pacebacteria bacterium]|nr:restriction endonuclease [Candidatus Paceibacterota bacterium]
MYLAFLGFWVYAEGMKARISRAGRYLRSEIVFAGGLVVVCIVVIFGGTGGFWQLSLYIATALGGFATALFMLWKAGRAWFIKKQQARQYKYFVTLEQMRTLSPLEFEHYVAWLYRQQGYLAEVTPAQRDGGIDIYLKRSIIDTRPCAAIQVKQYRDTNRVERQEIDQFFGAYHGKVLMGVFVTTSTFTEWARESAAQKGVTLVDGVGLMQLAQCHGLPDSYKSALSKSPEVRVAERVIVTAEVVKRAHQRGCISDWEHRFMHDHVTKPLTSDKQRTHYNAIKSKIMQCSGA